MSSTWKALILISILLNVLLFGFVVGKMTTQFAPPPHGGPPPHHSGMESPHARLLLNTFMPEQAAHLRVLNKRIAQLRQRGRVMLLKESPDTAEYNALLRELKQLQNQKFDRISQALLTLPLAQRQQFVEAMKKRSPPLPRH